MTSIELLQDELINVYAAFIISTAQIKKNTAMEVPLSISIKTDTWDIYVTLLNELSAFGETFTQ